MTTMKNKEKNIFISHHNRNNDDVQLLQRLIDTNGYTLRNVSVDDAENEEDIYGFIRPFLDWAGVMIVLIDEETCTNDWVNWEIEQAQKLGIRVIGVYANKLKQENPTLPESFTLCANALVGWTGNSIIHAIDGKINHFQNPDGTSTPDTWSSKRSEC